VEYQDKKEDKLDIGKMLNEQNNICKDLESNLSNPAQSKKQLNDVLTKHLESSNKMGNNNNNECEKTDKNEHIAYQLRNVKEKRNCR